MAEFTIHTIDTAPEDSREVLRGARQAFGFVPNLLGELAAAPAAVRAYTTLNELLGQTSLEPVEVQLVLTAASVANACDYCVAAHSSGLKQAGLSEGEIEAVRQGSRLSDPKLEALRRFVTLVVEHRGVFGEEEIERFLRAGYRREQILEVLVGVAMKTLSNYTNHIADTPLDEELRPFAWNSEATVARAS